MAQEPYRTLADDEVAEKDRVSYADVGAGKASVFSSIANLCNAILGAGLLALPYGFAQSGWSVAIAMLVLSGAASCFTLHLLTLCGRSAGGAHASFFMLARQAFPDAMYWVVDACVILNCFGLACSYLIVFAGLFPTALADLVNPRSEALPGPLAQRVVWVTLAVLVVTPLAFQRTLDALRFTSTLGVGFVLYGSVVVLVYWTGLADACDGNDDDDGSGCVGARVALTTPPSLRPLQTLSIIVFAYTAHAQAIGIANEVREYSQRKMDLISGASIAICGLLYVLIGFAGYRTFGDAVSSNLLESFPGRHPAVIVARLGFAALVSFSYPLMAKPARDSFFSLLENSARPALRALAAPAAEGGGGERLYLAFTSAFLALTWAIAAAVDDLGIVLSLLGATCSTVLAFIMPPVVFLSMHPAPRPSEMLGDAVDEGGAGARVLAVEEAKGLSCKRAMAKVVLVVGAALIPLCVTSTLLYET